MGVMNIIEGAKKSFKEYKTVSKGKRFSRELKAYEQEKAQLERENRELAFQKQRRDELERLRSQKAKLSGPKQDSKLKHLAKGLAGVINKGKSGVQSAKKQGFLTGAKFEPGRSNFGGVAGGSSGSPFGGARPIDVGGKMSMPKKEKPRQVTIKVM